VDEPTDELLDRVVRGDATHEETEAIANWRRAAPQHERRYRQIERIAHAAQALRGDLHANVPPTVAALLQRSWRTHAPTTQRSVSSRWWRGAAAAAVLLVAAGGYYLSAPRASTLSQAEIVTGTAELATIQLRDGSVIRLAPRSRLRLGNRPDGREVTLDGRAYFAVAKARGRPFLVHTRLAEARVLGTHFELATRDEDLELLVVEGHVALDAPGNTVQVRGGEASRVARGTATKPVRVDNAQGALRWIGKFLVFQSTPLHDVARELERTYGVRVAITDSVLAHQTVTATFTDRSAEQVMDVVCSVVNARCAVGGAGDSITMSRR
jgi:ferric-dicitrate binding protein FerR (iron transport regulator)